MTVRASVLMVVAEVKTLNSRIVSIMFVLPFMEHSQVEEPGLMIKVAVEVEVSYWYGGGYP